MPLTTHSATWDFNPADTVTLTGAFTFDLNDPSDSQTVSAVLTTLQGRTPQVTLLGRTLGIPAELLNVRSNASRPAGFFSSLGSSLGGALGATAGGLPGLFL